jgi:anti-sigma factor RsiW
MSEASNEGAPTGDALPSDDVDDEIIIKVSDYLDGSLPAAERDQVAKKIESDAAWKRTHDEMIEARKMISGMRKAKPPETFVDDVTGTIHKRSGGAFFGRRTLGDRVPFGVILILAIVALAVIALLMRSSSTGSLKVDKTKATHTQPTKPVPTP